MRRPAVLLSPPTLRARPLALALGAFGVLERLALASLYGPVEYGDTGSYLRLARALSDGLLSGYDGTRVPGYPAFLALVDGNLHLAWILQLVLGWTVSLMLFWLGWSLTRNAWIGFAAGMLYNLLPGPFLFEFNLLSETLSTFFLVAAFSLFALTFQLKRSGTLVVVCLLLGFVAGLAGLSRTLFFTLPIWLMLFILIDRSRAWREKVLAATALALPAALLLGGWIAFIYDSYGMLSPTTMGGYHMVQHTGEFFEYVPDEYATIREIYLEHRAARIAERGSQANTIWDAIPEMTQATGLSFFDLSRTLQRISIRLIREHPLLYLRNVVEGWVWFWKAPVYWQAEQAANWVRPIMTAWTLLGRGIELLFNAAFLVGSLAAVSVNKLRKWILSAPGLLSMSGFVWICSVIQTVADHGDNPRFLIPLQMFVVVSVLAAIQKWRTQNQTRVSV